MLHLENYINCKLVCNSCNKRSLFKLIVKAAFGKLPKRFSKYKSAIMQKTQSSCFIRTLAAGKVNMANQFFLLCSVLTLTSLAKTQDILIPDISPPNSSPDEPLEHDHFPPKTIVELEKIKFSVGPPAKFLHAKQCFFDNNYPPFARFTHLTESECTFECHRNLFCTHYNYYINNCDLYKGPVGTNLKRCPFPMCNCGIDCTNIYPPADVCNEDNEGSTFLYSIRGIDEQPSWYEFADNYILHRREDLNNPGKTIKK